ncbi:MAG: hypothetical protein P4L50_18485 [Anaerolineaceae bacterium]|nr:hypothetical protein [Anaerolineaceae bacterium]
MQRILVRTLVGIALLSSLLMLPGKASAHTTIIVGKYAVEIGWVNEPPIANQPNDVVVNVAGAPSEGSTPAAGSAPAPIDPASIDVSKLVVTAEYGGQSKQLTIQPLGEDTPGQYIAPMTPTRAGVYTIHLTGMVGDAVIDKDVQPEEVQTPDMVTFPRLPTDQSSSSSGLGLAGWLGIAGLVLGAIGAVSGMIALTRKHG